MRQTVKQYVASVKRIIPDVEHNVSIWSYPQHHQSHIAFWSASEPRDHGTMPTNRIRVPLVGSGTRGAIIRVSDDAPTPTELSRLIAG